MNKRRRLNKEEIATFKRDFSRFIDLFAEVIYQITEDNPDSDDDKDETEYEKPDLTPDFMQ